VQGILDPMKRIAKAIREKELFAPGGQSTQLIVGATPETDFQILDLADKLYSRMKLKRVYYSAYVPVNRVQQLPLFFVGAAGTRASPLPGGLADARLRVQPG